MAQSLAIVNVGTDTFQNFIDKTNLAINAIGNVVITANNNANGAITTGNSFLYGIFGANTVTVYNSIRGGNVQTGNTLAIESNTNVNGYISIVSGFSLGNSTVNVSANSTQLGVGGQSVVNTSVIRSGNSYIEQNRLYIGNSTVNVVANSSQLTIGANVSANTTAFKSGANVILSDVALTIGNSTINVVANSTQLTIGGVTANSTVVKAGNSYINYNSISVGNSTVNTFVNSSVIVCADIDAAIANITSSTIEILVVNSFSVNTSIAIGNSTANLNLNKTSMVLANSVSRTSVGLASVSLGNSTVNLSINSTGIAIGNTLGTFIFDAGSGVSNTEYNARFKFANVTTTGATPQLIDSFVRADYRTCEYTITVKDNTANNFLMSKMIVMHDNDTTDAKMNEYASIVSNTLFGSFTANSNSTHIKLNFSPLTANTTVAYSRIGTNV